jgi:hypothetical protein
MEPPTVSILEPIVWQAEARDFLETDNPDIPAS